MAVRVLRLEVPWVVRVSGHEVLRRDLGLRAATEHTRHRRRHLPQGRVARSARYSWMNPSRIAKPTITPMAMASTTSPRYAETAVAMSRMRMRRFWNWASNTDHGDTQCTWPSSLGPIASRRRRASPASSLAGVADRRSHTSVSTSACQDGGGHYSIRVSEKDRCARRAVAFHQASGEPAERMVSTGTSEPRTTRSATLPNHRCDSPVRPWVPMTMRSRPLAASMIST